MVAFYKIPAFAGMTLFFDEASVAVGSILVAHLLNSCVGYPDSYRFAPNADGDLRQFPDAAYKHASIRIGNFLTTDAGQHCPCSSMV